MWMPKSVPPEPWNVSLRAPVSGAAASLGAIVGLGGASGAAGAADGAGGAGGGVGGRRIFSSDAR